MQIHRRYVEPQNNNAQLNKQLGFTAKCSIRVIYDALREQAMQSTVIEKNALLVSTRPPTVQIDGQCKKGKTEYVPTH